MRHERSIVKPSGPLTNSGEPVNETPEVATGNEKSVKSFVHRGLTEANSILDEIR